MPFRMTWGDIAYLETDAVVNAAYPTLRGGDVGVHGRIFNAAGREELEAALADIGWRDVGEVVVTPGFRLTARYILHAVAPIWGGGGHFERERLAQLYRNALEEAVELGLHSVAFPLLGADSFGFPTGVAMDVAVAELSRFVLTHDEMDVCLVLDRAWPHPLPDPQHGKLTAYLRMRYAEGAPEIPLRPVGTQRNGAAADVRHGSDAEELSELLRVYIREASLEQAKPAPSKAAPQSRKRSVFAWLGGLSKAVWAGLWSPLCKLRAALCKKAQWPSAPMGDTAQVKDELDIGSGEPPREHSDAFSTPEMDAWSVPDVRYDEGGEQPCEHSDAFSTPEMDAWSVPDVRYDEGGEPPSGYGDATSAPVSDTQAAQDARADENGEPPCEHGDVASFPREGGEEPLSRIRDAHEAIFPPAQPSPPERPRSGMLVRIPERADGAPLAAPRAAYQPQPPAPASGQPAPREWRSGGADAYMAGYRADTAGRTAPTAARTPPQPPADGAALPERGERHPHGLLERLASRSDGGMRAAPMDAKAPSEPPADYCEMPEHLYGEQYRSERANPVEFAHRDTMRTKAEEKQVSSAARARSLQEAVAHLGDTFSQAVLHIIDERGWHDVDVYKHANLNRKLFSKLRSDKAYQPSKQTAVALCVALELNLDDALDLLARAGYTLAACNKADLIAAYFIEHAIFDVFQLNEALFAFDQPCLGVSG